MPAWVSSSIVSSRISSGELAVGLVPGLNRPWAADLMEVTPGEPRPRTPSLVLGREGARAGMDRWRGRQWPRIDAELRLWKRSRCSRQTARPSGGLSRPAGPARSTARGAAPTGSEADHPSDHAAPLPSLPAILLVRTGTPLEKSNLGYRVSAVGI